MSIFTQIDNIIKGKLFNKLISPNKLYIKTDLPKGLHIASKFGIRSMMSQYFDGYFLITDAFYKYKLNNKDFKEVTIPDDANVIIVDMYRAEPVIRDEIRLGHLYFVSDKILII